MKSNKLDIFNTNIIKWYPFKPDKTIIQIGENTNITKYLEKNLKKVKQIKDTENIDENNTYDYVLIYGYEKYSKIIPKIEKLLNPDGTLLIIGENEIGINNWSKYNTTNQKGILRLENCNKKLSTISNLKNELRNCEFEEINTFYAFPNYKETELILNENFKIEKSHIEKYNPEIYEDEIKIFDEAKVLKNLILNNRNILETFANAYLIEVSKQKNNDIKYVSFNNCRKQQYQLMTIIKNDSVQKLPANETANSHIKIMANIIQKIKNSDIEILDYVQDGKIYSKLIKNEKTLDLILAEKYFDIDQIVQILNEFKKILLKHSETYENCKDKVKIEESTEILQQLNYLPNGYWDMIPKNCFYIDNKFLFFDQEWTEKYLPVEFIIYRSIINSYDLVRKIDIDQLLDKLKILEYKNCFMEIDQKIRMEILDEDIYEKMYKRENLKAVDNLINENKSYDEENTRKDEYIKVLERKLLDLEIDNTKQNEHIKYLERILKEKKDN